MEITSLELILKLLQDDKITVSEAMQLIQGLQNKNNITYVPSCPNTPYTPTNPYYQYYQVWCGDDAITTSDYGDVARTDCSYVGFSSNHSYAKC